LFTNFSMFSLILVGFRCSDFRSSDHFPKHITNIIELKDIAQISNVSLVFPGYCFNT
jgi:hypothetical protein